MDLNLERHDSDGLYKCIYAGCRLPENDAVNYPQINEIVTVVSEYRCSITDRLYYVLLEYPDNKIGSGINGIVSFAFRPIDFSFGDCVCDKITIEILKGNINADVVSLT